MRLVVEYRGRCAMCGRDVSVKAEDGNPLKATCDHVVPVSRGGLDVASNQQLACLECNRRKGDKMPEELQQYGGES